MYLYIYIRTHIFISYVYTYIHVYKPLLPSHPQQSAQQLLSTAMKSDVEWIPIHNEIGSAMNLVHELLAILNITHSRMKFNLQRSSHNNSFQSAIKPNLPSNWIPDESRARTPFNFEWNSISRMKVNLQQCSSKNSFQSAIWPNLGWNLTHDKSRSWDPCNLELNRIQNETHSRMKLILEWNPF